MKKRILAAVVAAAMLLTAAFPCALAEREDKKEMVYVLADATGEVNEIIVSEHLYNRDREAQLRDVSRLTDIENVGEDMTFATDGDAMGELRDGVDELAGGVDELADGANELNDGAGELSDGLDEIDSNSDELVDAAKQILQTVLDTANDTLAESKADFDKLGIELHTLTVDNYGEEIERLERELLANVEDYVYEQADRTLKSKVYAAVYAEVVSQVRQAAR